MVSLAKCASSWLVFDVLFLCLFYKKLKTSAVSTTDGVVETQLCKLHDTSDTFVGRAYYIFQLLYGVCELNLRCGC